MDVVAEITSCAEHTAFSQRLLALKFDEDTTEGVGQVLMRSSEVPMARITGSDPRKHPFFSGLFVRIVYALTKRKVGRVVLPVQVTAHHPKILWGYGQMEQSLLSSHLLDPKVKSLADLRVATLVGCPF